LNQPGNKITEAALDQENSSFGHLEQWGKIKKHDMIFNKNGKSSIYQESEGTPRNKLNTTINCSGVKDSEIEELFSNKQQSD